MARPRTTLTFHAIVWHEWRRGGDTEASAFLRREGAAAAGSGVTVQGHHSLLLLCDPSFLLHQSLHSDSTQPPQALMAHHAWTFIIVRSSCEAGSSTKFKTSSERLFVGEWACLS
jgi:hypothetical protein